MTNHLLLVSIINRDEETIYEGVTSGTEEFIREEITAYIKERGKIDDLILIVKEYSLESLPTLLGNLVEVI